jgi:glutamine synthetase
VRLSEQSLALFEEMQVLSRTEMQARYEIDVESYVKRIQIESRVLGDIARNHIVPTAVKYQNTLIENVSGLKEIFGEEFKFHAKQQISLIKRISEHIEGIHGKVELMIEARKKANTIKDATKRAESYCNKVRPFLSEIRYHCDKLELMIDDELWPLTKYRELMFTR